jgi:outer membrane protein assembly factor BamE
MFLLSRGRAPSDVLGWPIGYDDELAIELMHHNMSNIRFVVLILTTLLEAGCGFDWIPFVYRQDIHQGNVITQEMVDQLRPGMTQRQVTYIMGAPLLVDPFHDNRWDYIYSNQPGDEPRVQKTVTLIFKGESLDQLQGDFRPGTLPSIEMKKDSSVEVPKIDREKTVWQMVADLFTADDE